jgi:predicted molibdopterin-dependent oxidoreductase YjgC
MMHIILKEKLADLDFIEKRTENFSAFKRKLAKFTPQYVERITGIPAKDLKEAAKTYARAKRAILVYSMGITQHTTGTDNVLSLANLVLLTSHVGRPYTGLNPLRGQNNVQGACDVGALPSFYSGYQKVSDAPCRGNSRGPGM